jgi:hypothetical protein
MLPSSKTTLLDQESDKSYGRELNEEDVLCIEEDASDDLDESSLNDDESDVSGGDDFKEKGFRILKKNQDKTQKKERKQLVKQERQEKLKTKIKKAVKKRKQKLSMEKRKK